MIILHLNLMARGLETQKISNLIPRKLICRVIIKMEKTYSFTYLKKAYSLPLKLHYKIQKSKRKQCILI